MPLFLSGQSAAIPVFWMTTVYDFKGFAYIISNFVCLFFGKRDIIIPLSCMWKLGSERLSNLSQVTQRVVAELGCNPGSV